MTLRQNHPKLLEEKVFVSYSLILLMHMTMIYIQMMKQFLLRMKFHVFQIIITHGILISISSRHMTLLII